MGIHTASNTYQISGTYGYFSIYSLINPDSFRPLFKEYRVEHQWSTDAANDSEQMSYSHMRIECVI